MRLPLVIQHDELDAQQALCSFAPDETLTIDIRWGCWMPAVAAMTVSMLQRMPADVERASMEDVEPFSG